LSVRLPEKCNLGRTTSFNEVQVNRFFYNLRAVFEKHNFPPNRIFNLDESGISTVPNKLPKVTAEKGKRVVGKVVSADRGRLVTFVCCFSASGVYVPPAMIFPRKRMCNELYSEAPIGTLHMISDTGYTNTDLLVQWLHHFQNNVKEAETGPVLLVLDNHISHCSLEAVIFCRENHVTLLSIPPHGSDKIQHLDCGIFGPLKSAYSQERDALIVNHAHQPITQRNVAGLSKASFTHNGFVRTASVRFMPCKVVEHVET
jgi:hypothetical protein